jgi:hypothetical protein
VRSYYKFSECDLEHIGYEYTHDSDGSITLSVNFKDLGWHALKQNYIDAHYSPSYFCITLPHLFHRDKIAWVKTEVKKNLYR